MRNDAVGIFWQELDNVAKDKKEKRVGNRPLPPIPDTGWVMPTSFPDLSSAKRIALDCETKDVDLLEKGPGVRRGAHIVGLAIGTDDGFRAYYPIRHEVEPQNNLDPATVMRWAAEQLSRPNQPKVGANLSYDLDFLAQEGVNVSGPFHDIQVAEPLIDENQYSYSLGTQAKKYLGEGKKGNELRKWVERAYGTKGEAYRGEIWRCPARLVGPYAEGDVDLPLRILEKQMPILAAEGLERVWLTESKILPIMVKMRRRGVRVDLTKAKQLENELSDAIGTAQTRLNEAAHRVINVNGAEGLKSLFNALGVQYPTTDKGNPSFTREWLEHHPHPACMMVVEVRKLTKLRDTFIRSYILNNHINGRIHCQFNQLKSDDSGTVSGRFCVHGSTILKTSRGAFRIDEYEPTGQDTIETHKGEQKRILRRIDKGIGEMVRACFSSGHSVECTIGHRLFTPKGWKHVSELKPGEEVYCRNVSDGEAERAAQFQASSGHVQCAGVAKIAGGLDCAPHRREPLEQCDRQLGVDDCRRAQPFALTTLLSVEPVGASRIWDIEVEEDHSYLAGGLIHHNSSSLPNLQNIPARDPVWGPKLRSLFLPEEGEDWFRHDWSQIEYRFLAHYGVGSNAEVVRGMYRGDPSTDFHDMTLQLLGWGPDMRKPAKNVNFGLVYGMGPPTLAAGLGLSLEEATSTVFDPYHAKVPFVQQTYDRAAARAAEKGFIKTISGRRARFNLYEAIKYTKEKSALTYNEAVEKWGKERIKRAFTYRALNRLLQGSAADLMKEAMVAVDESGVPAVCGVPLVTVHDELGHSTPPTTTGREAMQEVRHIMETVMVLKVPILAAMESGPNWGECV